MTAIADQSTMAPWPAWVWAVITLALLALAALAAYDSGRRTHRRRAAEYEVSAYGSMRNSLNRFCELRGHDYHLNADGTHWVCVRGDDKVARLALSDELADLDDIENYANGGAA